MQNNRLYTKYEFCKSIRCQYLQSYNGLVTTFYSHKCDFEGDKCIYTIKEFNDWLDVTNHEGFKESIVNQVTNGVSLSICFFPSKEGLYMSTRLSNGKKVKNRYFAIGWDVPTSCHGSTEQALHTFLTLVYRHTHPSNNREMDNIDFINDNVIVSTCNNTFSLTAPDIQLKCDCVVYSNCVLSQLIEHNG